MRPPPMKCKYEYEKIENKLNPAAKKEHAVFGSLAKNGAIERFDIYKSVPLQSNEINKFDESKKKEIIVADVRVGKAMNGHKGLVHGGVISLLFDETFSFVHEAIPLEQIAKNQYTSNGNDSGETIVVTANLNVTYKKTLPAASDIVIRVYHEKNEGRKIYLYARMENRDGSMLYSDANVLFVVINK